MNLESELNKLINSHKNILIIQADNPDGDSLASSLALEQILHDMGKEPLLYCGVAIPKHLRYLSGWDRVLTDIPNQFDIAIIVDCSSKSLLENSQKSGQLAWVLAKPIIIIDHHNVESTINAQINYNKPEAVATGEVIYELAIKLNWPLNLNALSMIAVSILSDSLGLMTDSTTSKTIRIIADLVDKGVNLPQLEENRRETMKKSLELTKYKGELLQRIETWYENNIATITIPWSEIEKYSSFYNPSILVLDEMRMLEQAKIAIAFKTYPDGRVTAKIRANYSYPIANQLAEHFGGGGHPYASGFKVNKGSIEEIKSECVNFANNLLQEHEVKS